MSGQRDAVTFLFTDIEGSTSLWERFPKEMYGVLEQHDKLLREAVTSHRGRVFKTVGDAVLAVFPRAVDALRASVAAQRALAALGSLDSSEEETARIPSLRVRMGVHTGPAEARDGDYFGLALSRCARLQSAGHGGQILVSLGTQRLVRDVLPAGYSLRDLGEHRLKDLTHTEHIFQLVAPGLTDVAKPLSTQRVLKVSDRIVMDPAAESRSVPELYEALRDVVIDPAGTLAISPRQLRALAEHRPEDLHQLRLGQIAEWSQPQYRIDGRFVALELLIDRGEAAIDGRWVAHELRYDDLETLLDDLSEPAMVLLGPPGAGKSTLLRHLELSIAARAIAGATARRASERRRGISATRDDLSDPEARVTFFAQLNQYGAGRAGAPAPLPETWLAERWSARYPDLPTLSELLERGRMILLLDALNEMPSSSEDERQHNLMLWKDFLLRLHEQAPGNRVVFSCRSLDYSQPLSTPRLRVPQVRISPLGDLRVRTFLELYCPLYWREIWSHLEGSRQLDVLRSPFFLRLYCQQVETTGRMPTGRANLFTGFVRQTLKREVERDNPLFAPDGLLTLRDVRRITQWRWASAYELPHGGPLLPALSTLAYEMQAARSSSETSQVRIRVDDALAILEDERAGDVIRAGVDLSILDEDLSSGEMMYAHQLLQEYFAGRKLARAFEPSLVRSEWRADRIQPSLDAVVRALDPADPLPRLPQTGWEESTLLAAVMAEDPERLLTQILGPQLVLAGRAAAQPELQGRLDERFLMDLRRALVARSRDPAADLRERIAAGLALGDLGDPRLEERTGPHGRYLLPPLVGIEAARYPIGDDEPIGWAGGSTSAHAPRHAQDVAAFQIARFAVTNAEYRCFVEAGGYEDERWWDTRAARDWRKGVGTAEGMRAGIRHWRRKLSREPGLVEQFVEQGIWNEATLRNWTDRIRMSDAELDAHLHDVYPDRRFHEPGFWSDPRFNGPSQPVVGVSWYEARAYLRWLSAQSGMTLRLPTEVEWEAAARGIEGRRFAFGDRFDHRKANTTETHLRRSAPVGVFPEGDTPTGLSDLAGNSWDWTSSAFGRDPEISDFGYPYSGDDGRERADVDVSVRRVLRGGAWYDGQALARAVFRSALPPDSRGYDEGLRIARSL